MKGGGGMGRARRGLGYTLGLVEQLKIARTSQILKRGGRHEFLRLYSSLGFIQKVGSGLFAIRNRSFSRTVQAWKRSPHSVLCLNSALWIHGFLNGEPPAVWLA